MSEPFVKYLDETEEISCPYGHVRRVVTGGEGGAPVNIHVVDVSEGGEHYHLAYDEVYYVLSGAGDMWMADQTFSLRPGAVVNVPRGIPHSLKAHEGERLVFIIVGSPGVLIDDERARPMKP